MADTIHDLPDNHPWLPGSTRYPLSDIGEQAARLGSMVTYDRRGEVVWMSEFQEGLAGLVQLGETVNDLARVTADNVYRSPYAAYLYADGVAASFSALYKYYSPSTLGKAGYEIALHAGNPCHYINLNMRHYDGSTLLSAILQLHSFDSTIKIQTTGGVFVTIATGFTPVSAIHMYHMCKLVVDFSTGYYKRALINETEYNLSQYPLLATASAVAKQHNFIVNLTPNVGTPSEAYVGHIIITGNEP